MKAFFKKIWDWVLAHKLIAGIIAGATVAVLVVAIAVPCGVSASRKRKAAEQETQQNGGGSQQNTDGGQQQGGEQGGGGVAHTHKWSASWTHDETNHWHVCSGCDEKSDLAAHSANDYGFCSVCGMYMYATQNPDGVAISTGELAVGAKYYTRFNANALHTYQLTFNGWISSELKVYYQDKTTSELVLLERPNAGKFTTPASDVFDNYVYLVGISTGSAPSSNVTLALVEHSNLGAHGFCIDHPTVYGGFEAPVTTNPDALGYLSDGTSWYLRFAIRANHTYKFYDKMYVIFFTKFSHAYLRNASTNEYTEVALTYITATWQIATIGSEVGDGYLYVDIDPVSAHGNPKIYIAEEHPYQHGLCLTDGAFNGGSFEEESVAVDSFDLPANGKAYLQVPITNKMMTNENISFGSTVLTFGSDDVQELELFYVNSNNQFVQVNETGGSNHAVDFDLSYESLDDVDFLILEITDHSGAGVAGVNDLIYYVA